MTTTNSEATRKTIKASLDDPTLPRPLHFNLQIEQQFFGQLSFGFGYIERDG